MPNMTTTKTRTLLLAGLAAASVGLAACGGGSTSAPRSSATSPAAASKPAAMTAQDVGVKLRPLGCAATPDTSTDTVSIGDIKPKVSLDCKISGEDVVIEEYANQQQITYNMNLAKGAGCAIAKGFGITDITYVAVSNVTVAPNTTGTARQIQDAVGGKLNTIHC
jgi:hypothetical protein